MEYRISVEQAPDTLVCPTTYMMDMFFHFEVPIKIVVEILYGQTLA